mmetsp:Transcript_15991/g.19524  ORF Transcript_15991/g.19524 Transcript_15991/m.19524 type:complete len:392 (+) Transcript_15991:188-1363(+)
MNMSSESTDAYLLTEETVPAYLNKHASEIGVISPNAKMTAKAIMGGNVNYAFRAVNEEDDTNSIFVKQAPEFVAVFGPDGLPLTSDRMKQEIAIYDEWRKILGDETEYLPKIYFFDTKMMVTSMEFLEGFTLLDHDLVEKGIVSDEIAAKLGQFMGKTHSASHCSQISDESAKNFTKSFENRAMRDIQLEFVFTKCYKEATEDQKIGLTVDETFMKEVEALKSSYDGNNKENLCLCHGDLHPGSIMVSGDDVKIIDPEFTVYGPPALDVGSLLSGYVLAAVHQSFAGNKEAVQFIVAGIDSIWTSYEKSMKEGGIGTTMLAKIEVETVGFTVAEVCRTALEFAGDRKWLQFDDPDVKLKSKKAALSIVSNCMTSRHDGGMSLLITEIKKLV